MGELWVPPCGVKAQLEEAGATVELKERTYLPAPVGRWIYGVTPPGAPQGALVVSPGAICILCEPFGSRRGSCLR